ncbi:SRPBCC domain-containing protein [Microbacterium sp. cf332]|uniref:SRPBCC family protein n=1 Tax=Microbacterium sp. cf332 TaxID=1761804 RepID=UPI00088E8F83|nr:SRPBCC domain-containing protein [Microbacterium sp. cf332]SDQ18231.1 Uncharacterized conserved protein YndB, AHSA1/START domain [Microbacterium sp. cf332]
MPQDAVTASVTIAASVDRVWEALTRERSSWWPELVFEPMVGAALEETWWENGRRARATGTVTTCDPPTRLVFVWHQDSWQGDLEVDVRIAASGGMTAVFLTESGFVGAATPAGLPDEHVEGWRFHLARLRRVSEGVPLDG